MKVTITTDDGEVLEQIQVLPFKGEDEIQVARKIIEVIELRWEAEEVGS